MRRASLRAHMDRAAQALTKEMADTPEVKARSVCMLLRRLGFISVTSALLSQGVACGGVLDVGWDEPRGQLPVDNRNPIILCDDGANDNWAGEYAMLFASTNAMSLAGIVIDDGWPWTDLDENMAGWQQMVTAARSSGLRGIPDPIASTGPSLVRPTDGNIDSTAANGSTGARFIIDTSLRVSQPFRPLVIVTGGRLTDVADAYLMDHTLPERVVVVAALGTTTSGGAEMGVPNGELDTWADVIVARTFRYIQVSTYYDYAADLPSSLVSQLPVNPFTSWIVSKQPNIENSVDQVGVQVVAIPSAVTRVTRVVQNGMSADDIPTLSSDPNGPVWLVTQTSSAIATARFWEMLLSPSTFGAQ